MVEIIVNIDVPTLDAARRFYEDGLGFTFRRTLFAGTVAELATESTKVYLIEHGQGSPAIAAKTTSRDYAPHWTPVHLDVLVEDLSAALAKALRAGASLDGVVQTHAWGVIVTLRDPFGHGICLLQFRGKGYADD